MQFGSAKDWGRGGHQKERSGLPDQYKGTGGQSRGHSYSPNEVRGTSRRFAPGGERRTSCTLSSWNTSHEHWNSSNNQRSVDYQHQTNYPSTSTTQIRSFDSRAPGSSLDWNPEKPNDNLSSANRYNEENFSDPGEDANEDLQRPYWNPQSNYVRPAVEKFDYQHEHSATKPIDFPVIDKKSVGDISPSIQSPQPCGSPLVEPINVLELANKISSLGPLIRDPRLLTRILKITKSEETLTSPKRDEPNLLSSVVNSLPNSTELHWSKPSEKVETGDQISRQNKLSEYSQKYKIVKKSNPLSSATNSTPNFTGTMSETKDLPNDLEQPTKRAGAQNVSANSCKGPSHAVDNEDSKKSKEPFNRSALSVPPFASKAQALVKDSFIKLKQEGRAKMSTGTPSSKTDSKQNQALLKMVVGSKDDSLPGNKSSNQFQSNAMGKLPGIKNILNSVMKTSISQALRNNMESSNAFSKIDSPSISTDKELIEPSVKDVLEPEGSYKIESDVLLDSSKRSSKERTKDNANEDALKVHVHMEEVTKDVVKGNRARKRQTISGKDQSSQQAIMTRKQAAASASSNQIRKKMKKRHFRGGTYNLYLSSAKTAKKRKKKGTRETTQADDELSMESTETTGSVLDSEDDDVSNLSEDFLTTSETSVQEEETTPPQKSVSRENFEKPSQVSDSDKVKKKLDLSTSEAVEAEISESTTCVEEPNKGDQCVLTTELQKDEMQAEDQKLNKEVPEATLGDDAVKIKNAVSISEEGISNQKDILVLDLKGSVSLSTDIPTQQNDKQSPCEVDMLPIHEAQSDKHSPSDVDMSSVHEAVEDTNVLEPESVALKETSSEPMEDKELVLEECEEVKEVLKLEVEEPLSPVQSETVDSSVGSHSLSDGELNKENTTPFVSPKGANSIASCVKTRQRIKRKHSVVDIDVNTINSDTTSINGSESQFKKPKKVQSNGLANFAPPIPHHPVTNLSKIVNSCFPKLDVFYDHKRLPQCVCTCQAKPLEARNDDTSNTKIYCQAVDSIDEKLIGCCNVVGTPQLVRPSMKIPFTAMCEVHLWRLKHHHCCPICGVFCSQGSFMQCISSSLKSKAQVHLFHQCCTMRNEDLGLDFCPHCAHGDSLKAVQLEINTLISPTFYLSQKPLFSEPRAKMTITRLMSEDKSESVKEDSVKFVIQETEKVLSSAGLLAGPEREKLDGLLQDLAGKDLSSLKFTVEEFVQAARDGDVENVLHMLALGLEPNLSLQDQSSNEGPLHAAATNGYLIIVHLLVQAGASVDRLDGHLYTALMLSVENGQTQVAQYLVKAGAQLSAKGEDGMTCLHLAARSGCAAICRLLLDTGKIAPNVQDDGGWTPIVWAAEHSHLDIVRLLVERGADPNMRDNEQNVALHWSAFSGNVDISHLFLELGSDMTATNEHGDTPLHIAARQNKYACVVLFLARGANIEAVNKENEIPIMCCTDPDSQTYMALMMNREIKKFAKNRVVKGECVIHSDITRGKEQTSIQCINGVDDEQVPTDYMYVVENCETSPINIDRTITSLQNCRCEDDCTSPNCTCATLSFKCWFDNDGRLLPEFNLPDPPMIFECNRACLCWKNCNNRALQHGILCRMQLFRTHNKGWGVRALKDIPKGTFICEYVGEIITDGEADQREDDSYLFDLDNRQDGETYCLDARYYGNISRFVNHQCEPNLVPVKVFVDHQDLSFPRIAFFSSRDIFANEELGFDYGEKFWVIKYKSFTCDCESPNCKYSKDTIHQTLENYYRRLKDADVEENLEGQSEAPVP